MSQQLKRPTAARTTLGVPRGGFGVALRNPKATFEAYAAFGTVQGTMGTEKLILQSCFAGGFIALGAWLALSVGGAIPGIKASDPGMQKVRVVMMSHHSSSILSHAPFTTAVDYSRGHRSTVWASDGGELLKLADIICLICDLLYP
jgi:hypothetical protein